MLIMDLEKMFGIVGVLTAVFFLVGGISTAIILSIVSNFVNMASAIAGSMGGSTTAFSGITTYLYLGWAYAILQILAGIMWIIVGIMCLLGKE